MLLHFFCEGQARVVRGISLGIKLQLDSVVGTLRLQCSGSHLHGTPIYKIDSLCDYGPGDKITIRITDAEPLDIQL